MSPQELAIAMHHTLGESSIGQPERWDAGTTAHGEWWALRARYEDHPRGKKDQKRTETVITLWHVLGSPVLRMQSGLRLPETGAEIIAGIYYVVLDKNRIRLPKADRDYDLITTLANQAHSTGNVIDDWTHEALLHPMLRTWAGAVATPAFGHSTAAKLVAVHERQRFSKNAGANKPAPTLNTACDMAWTLADQLRGIPEIDRRIEQQSRIVKAVSELCWWNEQDPEIAAHTESVH